MTPLPVRKTRRGTQARKRSDKLSTADSLPALAKSPTGIAGLDQITFGGLPKGRPTLVCGGAGCGKTLFGIEFLVRGATEFGEPGVILSFEEASEDLIANAASLGFDLRKLQASRQLAIDCVSIDRSEIAETGEYDLEGLFIRLGGAMDSVSARRVLIDTPEALFAGLSDVGVLRSELRRLFSWLKEKGVTAVITAENGETTLTRHGLEEYISDCVIILDHRLQDAVVTRRLRVLKYRGSGHGTGEYPFLIDRFGISVLPVTSLSLEHKAPTSRISSGIPALDEMLGGRGFYRGSTVLLTGSPGTGKTSMAGHFLDAACRRGEQCLFFAFEESPEQIVRNLKSIGLDLGVWVRKGLLHIESARPSTFGLEMHLVRMHASMERYRPRVVAVDPVTSLVPGGSERDVNTLVLRIVDFIKGQGATAFFTALVEGASEQMTSVSISSLVDTWLLVRNIEVSGERNRVLFVLKSRGMAHSNQVREFLLTNRGVQLRDVYLGAGTVLTGSARVAREAEERRDAIRKRHEDSRRETAMRAGLAAIEARIAALRAKRESCARELEDAMKELEAERRQETLETDKLKRSRVVQ